MSSSQSAHCEYLIFTIQATSASTLSAMIYTARVTKRPVDSGTKAKRHCAGTCKRKKASARAGVTHPLALGCIPLAAAAPPRSECEDPWPSPLSPGRHRQRRTGRVLVLLHALGEMLRGFVELAVRKPSVQQPSNVGDHGFVEVDIAEFLDRRSSTIKNKNKNINKHND